MIHLQKEVLYPYLLFYKDGDIWILNSFQYYKIVMLNCPSDIFYWINTKVTHWRDPMLLVFKKFSTWSQSTYHRSFSAMGYKMKVLFNNTILLEDFAYLFNTISIAFHQEDSLPKFKDLKWCYNQGRRIRTALFFPWLSFYPTGFFLARFLTRQYSHKRIWDLQLLFHSRGVLRIIMNVTGVYLFSSIIC